MPLNLQTLELKGNLQAAVAERTIKDLGRYSSYRHPVQENRFNDLPFARVLELSDATGRLVVASFDLTGLGRQHVEAIRERVQRQLSLPEEALLLCATHTHSTFGAKEFDFEGLAKTVVDLIAETELRLSPVAQLSERSAPCPPGLLMNRRFDFPNKDLGGYCVMFNDDCAITAGKMEISGQLKKYLATIGATPEFAGLRQAHTLDKPVNNRLHLWVLKDAGGKPVAALGRFNAHPVVVSQFKVGKIISSDFPAYMNRQLRETLGCPVLLFNGAFGNVRPMNREYSHFEAKRIGYAMADALIQAPETAQSLERVALRHYREDLPLRPILPAGPKEARDLAIEMADPIAAAKDPAEKKRLMDRKDSLTFFANGFAQHRIQKTGVEASFRLLEMAGVRLFAVPGEPFVELADQFEKASKGALTIGNCECSVSYLPSPEEADKGGYEPSCAIVAPKGLDRMIEIAGEMA